MQVIHNGYASGYTPESVRDKARAAARAIELRMAETGAQAVVVSGNSGIGLAHAALMLTEFPLVLCRKLQDNSHGNLIEGPEGLIFSKYIVLDDFVSSGATVRRICDTLHSQAKSRGSSTPICVGVVQYTRPEDGYSRNDLEWHSRHADENSDIVHSIPLFGV